MPSTSDEKAGLHRKVLPAPPPVLSCEGAVLRTYRPSDVPILYALDAECFSAPFRFSREALQRVVEAPGANTLVAVQQSVVIGFVTVHFHTVKGLSFGYVVTLDVGEPFRRAGVGRKLLLAAEREAQERGATSMRLHVFVDNTGARRFYEGLGYTSLGCVPAFYGKSLDALLLAKRLKETVRAGTCS